MVGGSGLAVPDPPALLYENLIIQTHAQQISPRTANHRDHGRMRVLRLQHLTFL